MQANCYFMRNASSYIVGVTHISIISSHYDSLKQNNGLAVVFDFNHKLLHKCGRNTYEY